MRIDAPKGTRVMFTNPDAGYLSDQERAQQYLPEGRIDPWCTYVELVEVPGQGFRTGYGDDG